MTQQTFLTFNQEVPGINLECSTPYTPVAHCGPTRAMAFSFLMFLDHTQRRTTVGRTPLDE